jgi:hypothetical protein
MTHLYQVLGGKVHEWRKTGYLGHDYPVLAEILDWAKNPDGSGFLLRPPQIRALETYWYLRLIQKTPHIFDLYKGLFPNKSELMKGLGIPPNAFERVDYDEESLWQKIREDNGFVREFRLAALRETLALQYPSYILALAMGAGKTALIGAIVATEFAMAIEYADGPFVQNALVFAPGLTIIESLRELAEIPYNRILPERLYKPFGASLKLTFTREGDPDIPIIENSVFNVVVTNTEKIRIQKETIRKSDLGSLFASAQKEDEARAEVANRRLRKLASLPHLAVFSDEAHHTYGQALDTELKKVRKTVDYLHHNSPNLICVVNTTGTPYFQRQLLRDVVVWYGLSEGIHDGILKDVSDNIIAYDFSDENVDQYITRVIEDFFRNYGDTGLPDGTPSKLALYFPQTDDVERLRPVVEAKLVALGLSPTLIVEHHTKKESKADFDHFKLKDSPHRIALLVDRGVEGWNVPALFACCLARKLKTSNNFVLQAASRCLRQIPGNTRKARIYLSMDNRSILDRQLQETYGETLDDLNRTTRASKSALIRLRKQNIPQLYVRQLVRTVVRRTAAAGALQFQRPTDGEEETLKEVKFTVAEQQATFTVLQQVGDALAITSAPQASDLYAVAVDFSHEYRVEIWTVYDELRRIYPEAEVPSAHLLALRRQIEQQLGEYEVQEETVEQGLALVKPEGFEKSIDLDGTEVYTAEILYPLDREELLAHWERWKTTAGEFGFHYSPYNFDSKPEEHFFEQMLREMNASPDEIEDIYFTGALTDPKKTDFYVEYRGQDGSWHRYTPDFVIRRKDGRTLIVEIKDARFEAATREDEARAKRGEAVLTVEGRKAMALRKWEELNSDRVKYEIIYCRADGIDHERMHSAKTFLKTSEEPST